MDCKDCGQCIGRPVQGRGGMGYKGPMPISHLFYGITERCNCECTYCFIKQSPRDMTFDIATRGIGFLAGQQTKNMSVTFFGGEPTLLWDELLVPLTIGAKNMFGKQIVLNLTTNGTLLDEERLLFAQKYGIGLLLSIDGAKPCSDINRPLRGGGSSFDLVAPKIPLILKYFPNTTFRATVTKKTVGTYYKNHLFAVEAGFTNTFFALDTYCGWDDESFDMLESEMFNVADLYVKLFLAGKPVEFNPLIRKLEQVFHEEQYHQIPKRESMRGLGIGHGKCGLGTSASLVLAPDGNMYSCQEMFSDPEIRDNFYVGNLEEGLDPIKREAIAKRFDPSLIRSQEAGLCNSCKVRDMCSGDCISRNYGVNRDVNIVPACVCRHENMMFEVGRYIYDQLKDHPDFISKVLTPRKKMPMPISAQLKPEPKPKSIKFA